MCGSIHQESNSRSWIRPIYIVLSDNSVKRLKDVQTQEKVVEQYADDSFFYLYTSKKFDPGQKLHLVSFLKAQVAQIKNRNWVFIEESSQTNITRGWEQ